MKKSTLYLLWAGLFIICAGLGFIQGVPVAIRLLLTLAFFVPPALLLYRAGQEGDRRTPELIRTLSFLSLLLTLVLLVLNFLSALGSRFIGDLVYYILIIVSSPMILCGYWVLSLFLWACLLMASRKLLKKM